MGAVRMKVQTADKKNHNNPKVIHSSPTYCELKSCVCKKQIQNIFNFKPLLPAEYEEKYEKKSSHLNQEYRLRSVYKRKNFYKPMSVEFDVRGQQEWTSNEGHFIMDYGLFFWL